MKLLPLAGAGSRSETEGGLVHPGGFDHLQSAPPTAPACGAEYTVDLIPKIRVEVLSDDADAETLVGVIVKSAGSGTIGDGKVWVAPLDSVTRVRTGETGSAAI